MQLPITVSVRHMREDPALIALLEEECRGLERMADTIISCRILLEKEQKLELPAGLYRVKAEITLPGRQRIVVKKEATTNGRYPALATLVRAVFEKTRLVVERHKEKRLSKKKSERQKSAEAAQ